MSHTELRTLDPEHLASELGWLRGLAQSLVRDADLAEDLVQDAVVVALERGGGGRSWLAGVLRNLTLRRYRGEGRRRERERRSARPEAVDAPDALSDELRAQEELLRAVLELEEPFGRTVQRRFYLGQSPRAIAAEDGVGVNTVNSRLQRGLAKLRARLDAAHGGDRSAWCLALSPLLGRTPAPAAPLVGGLLTVKTAMLLCTTAALAALALLFPGREPAAADASTPDVAGARPEAPVAGPPEPAGPAPTPAARPGPVRRPAPAPSTASAPPAAPAPEAPAPALRVRGRVVDVGGRFLPDVGLAAVNGGERLFALSGPDGSFEFALDRDAGLEIEADEPGLVTVHRGMWAERLGVEPVVVVADAVRFAGRVVDEEGRAVEDVRIELRGPQDLTSRIGLELDAAERTAWRTRTDAAGRFDLDPAPAFVDGLLDLAHPDFAPRLVPVPQAGDEALELVLRAPTLLGELAIRGVVLDGRGRPLPGAWVAVGSTTVACDARGLFEVDPVRALDTAGLVATAPGRQPVRLERPAAPDAHRTGWPEFVTVTLARETLAIAGRLVDAEGEPLVGARVWTTDGEPFGALGPYPLSAEGLASGAPLPEDAVAAQRDMPTEPGEAQFGWYSWRGEPDAMWPFAVTDADGRFRLEGLAGRDYTLEALLARPLETVSLGQVPAGGDEVELVVEVPGSIERLRGQVVDELGEPLEGITVQPYEVPFEPSREVLGGRAEMHLLYSTDRAVSDADGRFELEGVPVDGFQLWMLGDGILPAPRTVEGPVDPDGFVLELPSRRRLQVELVDPDAADGFEVVDDEGRVLPMYETEVGRVISTMRGRIAAGRSAVMSVGLNARRLVLLDGGERVDTLPLDLVAEGVTVVRY